MASASERRFIGSPTPRAEWRRWLPILMVLAWGVLSVAGLGALLNYEATPGRATQPPRKWPTGTVLVPNEQGPTLVMFAHPRCPCTRASLDELHRLVAQCGEAVKPLVVFLTPSSMAEGWDRTGLWRSATALPGARVVEDRDGQQARRFRVETSGHVLLYDRDGGLQFSGGITSSRGHHGDNPGLSALVALLTGRSSENRETPAYGCSIVADSTR